ncbi:extracellular solute-binding protein [Sphaerotilus natans subsp. natans DSM 6575]|uniref:Extracellular solute-binding protein n=1 Tax=Sphaerotilus natans subsp. natans DSM 6575 TaxID=1286631 RepID=A0A059KRZ5_9BURK|nr:Fe(3+) ABC transporter substrate-binding protein [Sphaerotilus natans]KDB54262.1 extracellular solute-binding protein [Sphaerotilus natans subsp. natans DSM 6575]SIR90054.1 iron(III) transport system substrate-binding protein [Sphaerotilus natans]
MTAKNTLKTLAGLISCLGALAATPALAQEQVLNLYSARHYQTDEALFSNFTKATGVKINIVSADDAGILQRLKSEGAASPADVILLVDAARLWFAETNDLFAPVKSSYLEQRIPAQLRGKDAGQGSEWFGYSTRARVVVYNKLKVKREDVDSYAKLADPKLKGQFCSRSGSHPYNLSLFGSYLEHAGPAATEAWLKGLVANQARDPKGGDTDQIKATASGECGVALSNTYYIARMMRSNKPDERAAMEQVGVVFPNQQSWGTHVNVAGGAMARHAKNRVAAVKFLEYLATDDAQRYFADGNNEYPAVSAVKISNPALDTLGTFKQELIPLSAVGQNTPKVQQMLDRAGYK